MKKALMFFLTPVLAASVMLSACSAQTGGGTEAETSGAGTSAASEESAVAESTEAGSAISADALAQQEAFDAYIDGLFKDIVGSSVYDTHFYLQDPEAYGIEKEDYTFGTYSQEAFDSSISEAREIIDTLAQYDYDLLTEQQQETADIITAYKEVTLMEDGLYLYQEPLNPDTGGYHIELPSMMAEYKFLSEDDIKDYLKIMNDFGPFFESVEEFEKKKSDAGLFMDDEALDTVIEGCRAYTDNPDTNLLITSFEERISGFDGIDESAKASYIEQNKKIVSEIVLPAYQSLIDSLELLRGTGKSQNGLSGLPEGKKYYEYLLAKETMTSKTPDEIISALEEGIDSLIMDMRSVASSNPNALNEMSSADTDVSDPVSVLELLKTKSATNYPVVDAGEINVSYVLEGLEDYTNPAYYVISPIDSTQGGTITLNNSQLEDDTIYTFSTLAHEGYPGHMLQDIYSKSLDIPDIRHTYTNLGYMEGWATYAAQDAFSFIDSVSEDVARLLVDEKLFTTYLCTLCDIYVNYKGMTLDDLANALSQYGYDKTDLENVFDYVKNNPAIYMSYGVGTLELLEMRTQAEQTLGDGFSALDFNTFILNEYNVPFSMMREDFNTWLTAQASGAKSF